MSVFMSEGVVDTGWKGGVLAASAIAGVRKGFVQTFPHAAHIYLHLHQLRRANDEEKCYYWWLTLALWL